MKAQLCSVMRASCSAPDASGWRELIGSEPIGPLDEDALAELLSEREELRKRVREEELTRPQSVALLREASGRAGCRRAASRSARRVGGTNA